MILPFKRELTVREGFKNLVEDDKVHVLMTENMEELKFTQSEMIQIHQAIHSKKTIVQFQKKDYVIQTGKQGCRFVKIEGKIRYCEDN